MFRNPEIEEKWETENTGKVGKAETKKKRDETIQTNHVIYTNHQGRGLHIVSSPPRGDEDEVTPALVEVTRVLLAGQTLPATLKCAFPVSEAIWFSTDDSQLSNRDDFSTIDDFLTQF